MIKIKTFAARDYNQIDAPDIEVVPELDDKYERKKRLEKILAIEVPDNRDGKFKPPGGLQNDT